MKKVIIILVSVFVFSGCCCKAGKNEPQQKDIAIQLYSVRSLIGSGETFNYDVLKSLAEMGYTAVETANYRDGLFYGMAPAEFRKTVEDAGMKVLSSHTTKPLTAEELASGDFSESLKWWEQAIAAHKEAGMKYIVTPYMELPETLAALQTYCNYYNTIGKMCRENGLAYGYHNHAHEFQKVENRVILEYMLENTNPEDLFLQLDVYWAVMGQESPVDLFTKYPGRFKVLHLKDHRELGQSGMVGFDAIFANTDVAGVENLVVEVEKYSHEDILQSIRESIDYLKK